MKTFADRVANSAMTSIVHRRTVLIVSTATRHDRSRAAGTERALSGR